MTWLKGNRKRAAGMGVHSVERRGMTEALVAAPPPSEEIKRTYLIDIEDGKDDIKRFLVHASTDASQNLTNAMRRCEPTQVACALNAERCECELEVDGRTAIGSWVHDSDAHSPICSPTVGLSCLPRRDGHNGDRSISSCSLRSELFFSTASIDSALRRSISRLTTVPAPVTALAVCPAPAFGHCCDQHQEHEREHPA